MHRSTSEDNIIISHACSCAVYKGYYIPILEIMHVTVNPRPPYLGFVYT